MRIYGTTPDGSIQAVGLLFEEVAANMIDPWRIDLADPDPVSEPHGELLYFRKRTDITSDRRLPPLSFRRLRDICLAYRDNNGHIFVCVHDGVEPYCVTGNQRHDSHDIALTDVEVSRRPFSHHYLEYLKRYHESSLTGAKKCFRMNLPQPDSPNPPRAASAAKLKGRTLSIHRDTPAVWGKPITFVGEMFAERSFPLPLPEDICWLLERTKEFKPVVYGRAIRDCLAGRKPVQVDLSFSPKDIDRARQALRNLGERHVSEQYNVTFPSGGKMDIVRGLEVRAIARTGEDQASFMLQNANFYSADCLWSCHPNEGKGLRIALMDVGRNQARALSNFPQHTMSGSLIYEHEARFHPEAISVIPALVA